MGLFGKSRRPDPLDGVNLLDLRPVRLAEWKVDDEQRVTLDRPKPEAGGLRNLGQRFAYFTASRFIRLDAIGSVAWLALDGSTSVAGAAASVSEKFGEEAEPVEERVGHFVRLLKQEGLLDYGAPEAL